MSELLSIVLVFCSVQTALLLVLMFKIANWHSRFAAQLSEQAARIVDIRAKSTENLTNYKMDVARTYVTHRKFQTLEEDVKKFIPPPPIA